MTNPEMPTVSTGQDPDNLAAEAAYPPPAIEMVTTTKIACSGDEALGLGHPRVWLAIAPEIGFVDCGYCDKRFMLDPQAPLTDH